MWFKPRLLLRRGDGRPYLTRWGFRSKWFSVYLHKIESPDPGADIHDHPWPFLAIVLKGGYVEATAPVHDGRRDYFRRYRDVRRVNLMRLNRAHTIISVRKPTWTLVFCGRTLAHRRWGFYTKDGWVDHDQYGDRGDLYVEVGADDPEYT